MPEGDILTGPVELLKGISSLHFTSHQNNGNRDYRIDFRNEKHPFCEDIMVQCYRACKNSHLRVLMIDPKQLQISTNQVQHAPDSTNCS